MITKLVSTAVKLYLRSQVSQVEDLEVKITGKNRQILKGYIPQVFLNCKKGIYQGLHLREVVVEGRDIAVNLPEIIKKKPLRLLEPIVVGVKLGLNSDDLLNSLDSSLLQSGLTDLWHIILEANQSSVDPLLVDSNIEWHYIAIGDRKLVFSGMYRDAVGKESELNLSAGVSLSNSHTLCLSPIGINRDFDLAESIGQIEIDLGKDVNIEKLVIESEQLLCLGKITVNN